MSVVSVQAVEFGSIACNPCPVACLRLECKTARQFHSGDRTGHHQHTTDDRSYERRAIAIRRSRTV
ncbi:MAG: hypothetical protein EAZ61_11245 [Oscillatoriales cyanobacterium]|nr:MAG: hypothetical protein EAZ61_11245 [Oscillatoriales cyanobacterium]